MGRILPLPLRRPSWRLRGVQARRITTASSIHARLIRVARPRTIGPSPRAGSCSRTSVCRPQLPFLARARLTIRSPAERLRGWLTWRLLKVTSPKRSSEGGVPICIYCVTPRGLTRAIVTEISWLHISLPPRARLPRTTSARGTRGRGSRTEWTLDSRSLRSALLS